jgi:hypothetical protein
MYMHVGVLRLTPWSTSVQWDAPGLLMKSRKSLSQILLSAFDLRVHRWKLSIVVDKD